MGHHLSHIQISYLAHCLVVHYSPAHRSGTRKCDLELVFHMQIRGDFLHHWQNAGKKSSCRGDSVSGYLFMSDCMEKIDGPSTGNTEINRRVRDRILYEKKIKT